MKIVFLKALYYWLQLRQSQWKPRDVIEADQWRKFKAILNHAYENVPFYREKFRLAGIKPEDIQTKADLCLIPLTTKEELRANYPDRVIAKGYKLSECLPAVTSGSTGEPLHLVFNSDAVAYKMAIGLRSIEMASYRMGDKILQLAPPLKSGSEFTQSIVDRLIRRIIVPVFTRDLSSHAVKLRRYNPSVIVGYTSLIRTVADYIEENGMDIRIKSTITNSEMLTVATRHKIERSFNTTVYDQYGSVEFGRIAQQCEAGGGYHINTESILIEFLKDGQFAKENETGEIVVTSLINYAMPLIRYRIDDFGKFTAGSCACGRGLPLLLEIDGRLNDVITTPGGNRILPEYFYLTIRQIRGIGEFQVVQETRDSIVVKIAKEKDFDTAKAVQIFKEMREYLDDVHVRFDIVDSLGQAGGKHKHIISLD